MQLLGQSAAWVGSEGEEQEGKAGTQSELGLLERQVQRPVAFRARRGGGEPAWANQREPTVRSEHLKCSGFSADCLQPRVVFCSYRAEPQQEEPRPPGGGGGERRRGPRSRGCSPRGSGSCHGASWGWRLGWVGGQGDILLPLDSGSESGPLLPALFRPPPSPLMRASVPGPAAGREPSTPGGGGGGAAVPGSVQLALSILHALLYAALFAFAYLQLWRLLLYRERRLSYQSLCLFLCLLWAALRTTLFSAAFSLSGSLPLLRPPAHLHFFPHWLLYCFPSCLQFSTLCLLNLYLAEVRREDQHAGPGGRAGPPSSTRAEDRWRGGGAVRTARGGPESSPGETESRMVCAPGFSS